MEFSNSPGNATETSQKGMIVVESGVLVWSRMVPEYAKAGFSPAEFHFTHMPSTPTDKSSKKHLDQHGMIVAQCLVVIDGGLVQKSDFELKLLCRIKI
jgi:hypothetical protein